MTILEHWRDGRRSNFPTCCIVWFLIRLPFILWWFEILKKFGITNCKLLMKIRDIKHRFELEDVYFICCPVHSLLYRIKGPPDCVEIPDRPKEWRLK